MIRAALKKDASRLAEILIFSKRMAYRPIFQNDIVSFQDMQVLDLALFYRDCPQALLNVAVFDDGIVKGMIHWEQNSALNNTWELMEIYVDPFFQQQGVGTALMKHFLSSASSNGVQTVFLWVLEKNSAARQFYEMFGYHNTNIKEEVEHTQQYVLKYQCDLCPL